jgi:sugar lactone lactonase YvrE
MESAYVSLGAAAPSGRLARYDPRTGQAEVLARGLWFANGAALSAEEDFLVVADSLQARLLRCAGLGVRRRAVFHACVCVCV